MSVLGCHIGLGLDLCAFGTAVNRVDHFGKPERGDEKAVPNTHALEWKNPFRLSQLVRRRQRSHQAILF